MKVANLSTEIHLLIGLGAGATDAGCPFFEQVVVVFLVGGNVIQILHPIPGVVPEGGDFELVGDGGIAGGDFGRGLGEGGCQQGGCQQARHKPEMRTHGGNSSKNSGENLRMLHFTPGSTLDQPAGGFYQPAATLRQQGGFGVGGHGGEDFRVRGVGYLYLF